MDFYKRMDLVCRMIPYGKAATYGQIALLCGCPNHARQVGFALSHRLCGQEIPAHRIVNSRGILSGAASFRTPDLQKKLLRAEGVPVSSENQVDLEKYGWKNTMDDALYLRAQFEKEGI